MTEAEPDALVVRRAGASPPAAARPGSEWGSDVAMIAPPFLLVWGAIANFGATLTEPAVFCAALALLWAVLLSLRYAVLGRPMRISALQVAAGIVFLALLGWTTFTLTPYGPVAEAWRLTGTAGAITMDRAATTVEIFKLAGLAAVFFSGLAIAQTERRADRAISLMLWVGAAYALWALFAFVQDPAHVLGREKTYHMDRLTASFMSANTAGSLFGVLACAAWVAGLRGVRNMPWRGSVDLARSRALSEALLRFGLSGLFWAALLMTVSRAAAVAAALCLILATVIELVEALGRRRLGAGRIAGYAAPIVLGMVVFFAATVGRRFVGQFSALGADQAVRGAIFDTWLRALHDAPLAGAGLGAFKALNATLMDAANFPVLWNLGAAHNIYLQWLLEGGAVGAGLMALTLLLILADIARRRVVADSGRTRATVALMVSAMLLLHNAVDYSIQVPGVAALWALLLGIGAGVTSRRERRPSASRGRRDPSAQDALAPGGGA